MSRIETIEHLLDTHAADLVEELLEAGAKEGGEPWFKIVRRKLVLFKNDIETLRVRDDWVRRRR